MVRCWSGIFSLFPIGAVDMNDITNSPNPYEAPVTETPVAEAPANAGERPKPKPANGLLLLIAIFSYLMAPALMTPTSVVQITTNAAGERITRSDPIGNLKINWPAYSLFAIGAVCLLWAILRGVHALATAIVSRGNQNRTPGAAEHCEAF